MCKFFMFPYEAVYDYMNKVKTSLCKTFWKSLINNLIVINVRSAIKAHETESKSNNQ